MKFKLDHMRKQLDECPHKLQEIALYMDYASRAQFKKDLFITRVTDAVAGESGVHLCHRAFDARVQFFDGREVQWYLTKDEAAKLADMVNKHYLRKDGKLVCLLHAVDGGMLHLHVQIPAHWAQDDTAISPIENKATALVG